MSKLAENSTTTRLVAGCMTGTSLDGLDAALVAIAGRGLDMRAKFIGMVSLPLGDLRDELRYFAGGGAAEPLRYLRAARRLGELHADAVAALCEQEGCKQLDFVVAHGQTIWHAPGDRGIAKNPPAEPGGERRIDAGVSWQLFDPWPIVRRIKVPVCYDLRQADLIAGGQGAPITPMSDWIMYRSASVGRLIINLGGICNVTRLPAGCNPEQIDAGDVGPCNLLIDGAVRQLFPSLSYDADGKIAQSAAAGPELEELAEEVEYAIFRHPYFTQKRSTGREDFGDAWVSSIVAEFRSKASPEALLAAIVRAVAGVITYGTFPGVSEAVLAGGGARNQALVRAISERPLFDKVVVSDSLGIPIEAREAMGFAVLGALSQDGVPITLPQVTGAKNPGRAGAWIYP